MAIVRSKMSCYWGYPYVLPCL